MAEKKETPKKKKSPTAKSTASTESTGTKKPTELDIAKQSLKMAKTANDLVCEDLQKANAEIERLKDIIEKNGLSAVAPRILDAKEVAKLVDEAKSAFCSATILDDQVIAKTQTRLIKKSGANLLVLELNGSFMGRDDVLCQGAMSKCAHIGWGIIEANGQYIQKIEAGLVVFSDRATF